MLTFTLYEKGQIGKRDVLDARARLLFLPACNRCVTACLDPLFKVQLIRLFMNPMDHIHTRWKANLSESWH